MKLQEDYLITLLFNSLSDEYETAIEAMQQNKAYKEMDKVLEVLKSRELKIKEKVGGNEALLARNVGKGASNAGPCFFCGKKSHKAADCWSKPGNERGQIERKGSHRNGQRIVQRGSRLGRGPGSPEMTKALNGPMESKFDEEWRTRKVSHEL